MTRNTIAYKEFEEKSRSNRAQESLKSQELAIKRSELAETVRNNLRNYGINIEKNQLQRLANDQLNTRESNKLLETIRSNLKNEELRLRELAEKARSNKEQESIQRRANEIKEMDSLLTAAKATGKDPASMLISWFTNQANLQAFGGKNVLSELFQIKPDHADFDQLWSPQDSSSNYPAIENWEGESFKNYSQRSPFYHGNRTRAKGKVTVTDPRHVYSNSNPRRNSKRKEPNEIPEDYSNSYGPGGTNEKFVNQKSQTDKSWSQSSRVAVGQSPSHNSNQFAPESNSTGTRSVIYSGNSSKTRENTGPGVAFS